MFATLVLFLVPFAAPLDADALEAREMAAEMLRSTLTVVEAQEDDRSRVRILLSASEAAAETLGTSVIAGELRAMAQDARVQETQAPGSAQGSLVDGLRTTLADLEFEPIVEAELPEGFPAPTPVGEIELKRYPVYRIARADSSDNGAFWELFRHIKKHDIPMTAPVEMTYDATGDEVDMAFMYEYPTQGSAGPDGEVEVTDIEPMLVASIGCRGWSTDAAVTSAYVELVTWIAARDDLQVAGPTRRFGYNGPSVPGARRYFEVQIPVRIVGGEKTARADAARSDDGSRG